MKYLISTIKYSIAPIIFFIGTGTAQAIPACAFQKFNFSIEDIVASLAIGGNPGVDVFVIDIAKTDIENNGKYFAPKILFIDGRCNLIYQEETDDPHSLFTLADDEVVIYNLQEGGVASSLDAYYLRNDAHTRKVTKILSMASRSVPAFFYSQKSGDYPDIYGCVDKLWKDSSIIGFGNCTVYRYNNKRKRYASIKHTDIDISRYFLEGRYRYTSDYLSIAKCLKSGKCSIY